mgnify:CR=1 FL=1
MNSKIKTYLSIPLVFLFVALLWSIAGNALFDLPKLKKESIDNENILSLTNIVYVKNINKSIEFYTEVLGFSLKSTIKDTIGIHCANLNLRSINLQIQTIRNDTLEVPVSINKNQKSLTQLLFQVNDIKVMYEKIKNESIVLNKIYETTEGNLIFDIKDPDDYTISFYEIN